MTLHSGRALRRCLAALLSAAFASCAPALAAPSVVIDVASGQILQQEQPTASWYPASLTKLMTAYVALDAVRNHRISLDTPLMVSPRATRMSPSKMGFRAGAEVTLYNALVMLMVKSANDIAVTIAEGVSGSVEAFAGEMNRASAQIGMNESYWVNPNGLPDQRQVTSARDLAILGRALYLQFPEYAGFFNIGAMQLGGRITPTHNGILGRYPGADGMKTGFTCPAGFNLVASATHGGTRLIAVVLGAPSASARTAKTAALLDRAFHTGAPMGSIASLPTLGVAAAPDMRDSVCRHRGKATAEFLAEIEDMSIPVGSAASTGIPLLDAFGGAGAQQQISVKDIARIPRPYFEPVRIYVGRAPGYQGPVARARAPGAPIGAEPDLAAYAQEQNETGASPIGQAAPDATPLRRQAQSKLAKGKRGKQEAMAKAPEKPAKTDIKTSAKVKPQGKNAASAKKDGKELAGKGTDGKAKASAANKSAGQDVNGKAANGKDAQGKDAQGKDAKIPAKAPGGKALAAHKPGPGR